MKIKLYKARNILFGYLPNLMKAEMIKNIPMLYSYFGYAPHFAVLNITDRCCFRCIMCEQWKRDSVGEMATDKWLDVLSQLKTIGIGEIMLSGGEPFMRTDILEIISYAHKIGLSVGVITNGYFLTKKRLNEAIEAGARTFAISLDATGEQFDNIRGIKGAYSKIIDSIALLSEYKNNGITAYVNFTLMSKTLDYYNDVLNAVQKFNFPIGVNLFDYTPYFFKELQKSKDLFWIKSDFDIKRLKKLQKDFVEKKQKDSKSVYHLYSEIEYFAKYFIDPLQKKIPCVVSQQRIGIDPQGNVYGGCWSLGHFGNLNVNPLKEIIASVRYKKMHKNMFFKHCPGCSCAYSKNLRYNIPSLIKEALFRLLRSQRKRISR